MNEQHPTLAQLLSVSDEEFLRLYNAKVAQLAQEQVRLALAAQQVVTTTTPLKQVAKEREVQPAALYLAVKLLTKQADRDVHADLAKRSV